MSNLSDLIPAGGGQNNTDFVADGTIVSGKGVILTAAGKAAPISMTGAPEVSGQTTPSGTEPVSGSNSGMTYDSYRNRLLIAFTEAAWPDSGRCVSGAISGTTATYGTAINFSSNNVERESACFDSDNNVSLLSFRDQVTSDNLKVVCITMDVSGGLTAGTIVDSGDSTAASALTYDTTNNVAVVAYQASSSSHQGTCRVVSISGTTPSFGAAANFNTGGVAYFDGQSIAFDSNAGKFVVTYGDATNSVYGTAVVGTVSGTTITYGTPVVFKSDAVYTSCITFDSNANKMVIAFIDQNDGESVNSIVGTVSGTAISFGSVSAEIAAKGEAFGIAFDSALNKVVLSYLERTTSDKGEVAVGTVSGTSITWTTPVEFYSALYSGESMAYNVSSANCLVAYRESTGSFYLKANVITTATSNMTATNLLGIASGAILDTATGTINTWGSRNEVQTGLTIGSDYYVQEDGTITTTSTSPAQLIGTAISATQINIKDYTG